MCIGLVEVTVAELVVVSCAEESICLLLVKENEATLQCQVTLLHLQCTGKFLAQQRDTTEKHHKEFIKLQEPKLYSYVLLLK